MLLFVIIASFLLKNVNYFDVNSWQWQKTNVLVKDGQIKIGAKEEKVKYAINGTDKYLFPGSCDLAVFLYGSPGGNIWEDEFIPEVQSKARKTILFSGISTYGILGAWSDENDINHGVALGPWITYPGSPPLTPYQLEKWNPLVFLSFKINSEKDIETLLERLKSSATKGVILPLPDDSNFEKVRGMLTQLVKVLHEKGIRVYGYSIKKVAPEVLKTLMPDVVIGWIPDTLFEGMRVLPLFLDTIPFPDRIVPMYHRLSLEPDYSFHKVGIGDYSLIERINNHNEKKLKEIPVSALLFGSGSGFIGRYFGHAFVNTINHWLSAGIPPDSVWKVILLNNRSFIKGTNLFVLYEKNPKSNPDVVLEPQLIITSKQLIYPPSLEYQIDSILPGPMPIGKPNLIVDFSSDSTLWGTDWKNSNLGFGLTGRWVKNCLEGKLARDWKNLWSCGQVINFERKFGEGWDLSIFKALKVEFLIHNVPVEISILSKYSCMPQRVRIDSSDSIAIVDLNMPDSKGVQGIKISPYSTGTGSYRICLKSISVVQDSKFVDLLIKRIFEKIGIASQIGDTAVLFDVYGNLKILNAVMKDERLSYLLALTNYRLIPLIGNKNRQLNLIEEGINELNKIDNIEARILEFSLRGYEMGLSPIKAIFGGGKMNKLKKILEREGQDNPRAYLVMGISRLYTPPMYGGSVDKAVEFFKKSIELFEQGHVASVPYSWGYADALVFLTIAYKKKGMPDKALEIAEKLREKYPYHVFGYIQYLTLK